MTTKFTLYGASFRAAARKFSTEPFRFASTPVLFNATTVNKDFLTPTNEEFPLPGNVTTQYKYNSGKLLAQQKSAFDQSDLLSGNLRHQNQMEAMKSFGMSNQAQFSNEAKSLKIPPATAETMECTAQTCPDLLKKDFAPLFPTLNPNEKMTVLTLTQKTQNDMSAWSSEMEMERDELTMDFIKIASSICDALKAAGYWADFIDPSSGRPYLGPFTNATLFETDERLENFGFKIEDLGCCKVISHYLWGTKAFAGALFTTAPLDSPIIKSILAAIPQ